MYMVFVISSVHYCSGEKKKVFLLVSACRYVSWHFVRL
jgi:hypothetical protein